MKPIALVPELYSSNLEKTLSFYIDTLGFEIVYKRVEEKFVYLKKGNAEMMFEEIGVGRNWVTSALEQPFGRGVNFQIETDSVDFLYKKIQDANLTPYLALEEKWYRKDDHEVGNRQFIIQDPDGYLLRFYQDLGVR